jgi:integrase
MLNKARKVMLSTYIQTEVVKGSHTEALEIKLSNQTTYHIAPITQILFAYDSEQNTHEIKTAYKYNLFPLVLDGNGIPWAEANIYLLERIKNSLNLVMATYSNIASDLVAYKTFLDQTNLNWMHFEKNKLFRPTYRYRAYLRNLINTNEISISTARRRMSSVIAFYRWLKNEGVLKSEFPMWKESDHYIDVINQNGFSFTKAVKTTDVSIKMIKGINPYTDKINDGGQLRPLPKKEQGWLLNALLELNNYEMLLIHALSLVSGARIQTVLTFRLHHVLLDMDGSDLNEVRIPAGPGTGIDTKNDKKIVLHIPIWFYQKLHIYALSEKAAKRRRKSLLGDSEDQYLFLSNRGNPFYQSKDEVKDFNQDFSLHHTKIGQTIRQFIKDRVIPYIQKKFDIPEFSYRFHDLRATFGMNLTDEQLKYVANGQITLHQAREFVKVRMCHESSSTTDLYLQYRQNLKYIRQVSTAYDNHLQELINSIDI